MLAKSKKIISIVLSIVIMLSVVVIMSKSVNATQNRTGNFNKGFSLTGNGAEDIVRVAAAQLGKTGSQLGYSEQWCADFVSDCAILANQASAIPANGYCPTLRQNIINAGGSYVSKSTAKKGDIVFYGSNGADHVEIVYAASNGNVSTYGGNSGSEGSLSNRKVKQHATQTQSIAYIVRPKYSNSTPTPSGENPTSHLDSVSGGTGSIHVHGWTFDRDDLTQSLRVHVYIGGSSSASGAEGHEILANASRPDVDNVYHVGQFHGFDATIPTTRTGNQEVYVYAINIGSGGNTEIGHQTVNISKDTTAPTISNVKITNIKNSSYTVQCNVSDNVAVDRVMFPSWHSSKTGSSAIWYQGSVSNGVAKCKIPVSELGDKEGNYITHIYAYDIAGNAASANAGQTYIDKTCPVISDVEVTDVDGTGYTVKCKVTDDKGVNRVQFPSWTKYNDQDDIISDWGSNSKASGTKDGDYYTYRVKCSEHNNESGKYMTHIYAYDDCENRVCYTINDLGIVCGRNIGKKVVTKIKGLQSSKVLCNENDKVIITTDKDNDDSIDWNFEKVTGTLYRISNNGKYLSYGEISDNINADVFLEDVDSKNAKLWLIEKMGTDNYLIVPQDDVDFNLDVVGGATDDGTQVQLYLYNGTDAQRFSFNKSSNSESVNADNYIPTDSVIAHGSKYEFYDYNVTWLQAKAICEKKGGHLATVTSESENKSIINFAKKFTDYYWLGATDRQKEGTWKWVTGEKFDYSNWGEGQPDNANNIEHYLESNGDNWNDIRNNGEMHALGFVCEYDMSVADMKPKETTEFNGHTYKYFDMQTTWYEAEKICNNLGGHLVTITSEEEQNTVSDLLKNTNNGEIWLGATDSQNEGTWKWITKESFNYSNWDTSQPDNANSVEHFAQMYKSGKWNDRTYYRSSSAIIGFVCEYEPKNSLEYTTVKTSRYLDNDYEFIKGKVSWHEARQICEEKGGHLVSISSFAENDFITNELKEQNIEHVWIGLTDELYEDNWKWVTGEKLSFTNWNSDEPNNTNGLEHYVEINCTSDKKWNDLSNYTNYDSLGFICEYENETNANNYIPKETYKINDCTYEFFTDNVTWEKAEEIAKQKGGHLTSITSNVENSIVQSIAHELKLDYIWLGGNDCKNEGEWCWNDGTPFSYSNWQDNEPNNTNDNESYIEMNTSNGRWNDIDGLYREEKANVGFVIKYGKTENTESTSLSETESTVESDTTESNETIITEPTEETTLPEIETTEPTEIVSEETSTATESTEMVTEKVTELTVSTEGTSEKPLSTETESTAYFTDTKPTENTTVSTNVSGITGDCNWMLNLESGLLTLSGGTEMDNYKSNEYAPWYKYCDKIKSVSINCELKKIGDYAFYNCKRLTSVEFNNSLVSIGRNAFCYCNSLTSITLPEGLESIGLSAFYNCEKLHDVFLPNSLEDLTGNSFSHCKSLESIKIPERMTTIKSSTFWQCVSLKEVMIPDNVKNIEDSAFMYCRNLKTITIPKTIEYIGDYAFGCYYESGYKVYEGFTVRGYSGTAAEIYAKANDMFFESLGVIENTEPTSIETIITEPTTTLTETETVTAESTESTTEQPTETATVKPTEETTTQPVTDVTEPTTKATETATVKPTEETTTQPVTDVTEPTTKATETTIPVTEVTEPITDKPTEAQTETTTKATNAPVTETTETAPAVIRTFNFLPNTEQAKSADNFKLVIQDTKNNLHTYDFLTTENLIDGAVVQTVSVPLNYDIAQVQYQMYKGETWIGQIVKSAAEISQIGENIVKADGTVLNPNEPTTSEIVTTAPISETTTAEPTESETEKTSDSSTTAPVTEALEMTSKKPNSIKVSVKKKTVKLKKLKKKAQKVKAITVKDNQGKVTYKLVKSGITKKIRKLVSVNSKGVIKIKKWKKAKKGTYKIKVTVKAAGNTNYNAKTITKTVKVKVK
jgi:hypothetical protein